MEFKARVSEEVALQLMRSEWPKSGLFVEVKAIEDTGRIKMELTKDNKTPTRTKVEYVRVTESIFDLKDELHRGELYYTFGDEEWFTFNDEPSLVAGFKEKNIYRRIETPITEREEFIEKVGDVQPVFDKRTNPMWTGILYDAGCRFVGE